MRAVEVVREAFRDLASGAAAAVVATMVCIVLLGGAALAVTADAVQEVLAAERFVDAGSATLVERADGRIDGAACDALSTLGSVRVSGAIRSLDDGVAPASLPRTTIPTFAMSRGFGALLDVDGRTAGAGVVLSSDVADRLGVAADDPLATVHGRTSVLGVYRYPDDGRDPALGFAALAPDTDRSGVYDECWATVWPDDPDAVAALSRTVERGDGDEGTVRPTLGQLNSSSGVRFEPHRSIDRPTAQLGGFLLGASLGTVFVLRRRLVLAADRHVGVSVVAQLGSQLLQASIVAVIGCAAVVPTLLVLVRPLVVADATPLVLGGLTVLGCGACGIAGGVTLGIVIVRERALFRYVKER